MKKLPEKLTSNFTGAMISEANNVKKEIYREKDFNSRHDDKPCFWSGSM